MEDREIIIDGIKLKDGLGYDMTVSRFYVNFYVWKFVIDGLDQKGLSRVKSGITRYDVNRAMREAAPTRGRAYPQSPIWGFEKDRVYLPDGISVSEANTVIDRCDDFFKDSMEELGLNARSNYKTREIGTEIYEGPEKTILETIKNQWAISLHNAIELVTDNQYGNNCMPYEDISFLGSQELVIDDINDQLKTNQIVRNVIPGGYGKGCLSFAGCHKWDIYKNENIIIYGHNIPAIKQMARTHSKYEEGTKYQGSVRRIVICSEPKKNREDYRYGIECYSASQDGLKEIIKDLLRMEIRLVFYVNKKSSRNFTSVWREAIHDIGIGDKKLKAIIDETQEFTGLKGSDNTNPVEDRIWDHLVCFTAGERRRGSIINANRIFNDDSQYFGDCVIEIPPSQALNEDRTCPMNFVTLEISEANPIITEVLENEKIEIIINNSKSKICRGDLLKNVAQITIAVNDGNSHVMNLTPFNSGCDETIELLEELQKCGKIPPTYLIIRGKRIDGLNAKDRFNSAEKAIIVGTPWIVTGIDAPKTSSLTVSHKMGSIIASSQYINRGQRKYGDKVCTVYMMVDPTEKNPSVLHEVAINYMMDVNSHHYSHADLVNQDDILGSIRRSAIDTEHGNEIRRENGLDLMSREYWDRFYENFQRGETYSFSVFSGENMNKKINNVIEIYHNGERLTNTRIEEISGVNRSTVAQILTMNGLESWDKIRTREAESGAIELYHNGEMLTDTQIARRLGFEDRSSSAWITGILRRNGLTSWEILNKEDKNSKILGLYHNGEKLKTQEIADILGISQQVVTQYLKKNNLKNWLYETGRTWINKKVLGTDGEGNIVKEFSSISELYIELSKVGIGKKKINKSLKEGNHINGILYKSIK